MAQSSYPWPDSTGHGGPYTDKQWDNQHYRMFDDGVFQLSYGALLVTDGGGVTVDVAAGAAAIQGKIYINDASLNLSGLASGTHYIVARSNYTAATITAQAVATVVQTPDTTWDHLLATVISNGTSITDITDNRAWLKIDATTVKGMTASTTAQANQLCALDGSAKLPASVTGSADATETTLGAEITAVEDDLAAHENATSVIHGLGSGEYVMGNKSQAGVYMQTAFATTQWAHTGGQTVVKIISPTWTAFGTLLACSYGISLVSSHGDSSGAQVNIRDFVPGVSGATLKGKIWSDFSETITFKAWFIAIGY